MKKPSFVRHAVYINLNHRLDRKRSIEATLRSIDVTAVRVEGVSFIGSPELRGCWDGGSKKCAGQLGCRASHVLALKYAQRMRWPDVAIFEDDFILKKEIDPGLVQLAVHEIQTKLTDWDVIALSLNVKKQFPVADLINQSVPIGSNMTAQIVRVVKAFASHGYLVKSHMIPKLITAFLECDIASDLWIGLDTCWQPLQLQYNWYGLHPQIGTQADSFSDIEQQNVSYHIV